MAADTGKISACQFKYSIACFVQSSILLTSFFSGVTLQDTWLAVLLGFALYIPVIMLYRSLVGMFPGKNYLEIMDEVFGRKLNIVISLVYAFYFWSLAALNTRDVGGFLVSMVLPETPIVAVMIFFMLLCVFAVRKGAKAITRLSMTFVMLTIVIIVFNTILLVGKIKLDNFLPAFRLPPIKYVHGSYSVSSFCFMEVFVFFIIVPNISTEKLSHAKPYIKGLLLGFGTLLFTVLRDVSVLGANYALPSIPSYGVVRTVNLADMFTRMEIFYALILLILHFFKVSMLLYGTVVCIAHAFKIKNFFFLAPAAAALTIVYGLISFDSPMQNIMWTMSMGMHFNTIFAVLIPVVLFITALTRGLGKKELVLKRQQQVNENCGAAMQGEGQE